MKKRQIILYIVIMLLLLCTSVYATITGSLSLTSSASTTAVSQGDSFNVVLSITNIDEEYGITGIDGYFQIDPDVYETLELSDITSLIDGIYVCDASDIDAEYEDEVMAINFDYASLGIYYVAIDSATGISATSDILQINLTVKNSVEDGTYYNTVKSVNFTVASEGNSIANVTDQSLIVLIGNTSSSGNDDDNTSGVGNVDDSGSTTSDLTGIQLNYTSLTIGLDDDSTWGLIAIAVPNGADLPDIVWTSSDESVVKIVAGETSGTITLEAVSEGTATITATTEDGEFSAECVVTVKSESGSINTSNNIENGSTNSGTANNAVDNTVASGSLPNTGYKLVLIPIFILVIVGFVFYKKYTTYNNIK